ncbi:MAG: hypothetical protein WCG99_00670 [Candidatus Berkelbacteria bacterium]
MSSAVRHFVLGLVLGVLSIIMLYIMFNSVVRDNSINYTSAIIVIIAYGVVATIIGEVLVKFSSKKK